MVDAGLDSTIPAPNDQFSSAVHSARVSSPFDYGINDTVMLISLWRACNFSSESFNWGASYIRITP